MKQAILLVSFGTSKKETLACTYYAIQQEVEKQFSNYLVYHAFTSEKIIGKIEKYEGVHLKNIRESLECIRKLGVKRLIVQPTYVICGTEYEKMEHEVSEFAGSFDSILFGKPLLNEWEDYNKIAEVIKEYTVTSSKQEAVVLMGHGTKQSGMECYTMMGEILKDNGHSNIYMAAMDGDPTVYDVIKSMKDKSYKKVKLIPFLVAAGYHAKKDMIGEKEDSWKNLFIKEGYEVEYQLTGLSEYPEIRELYCEHIRKARI